MAATTITRFTWTDDSGTFANPVGNGTTINNAQLQNIFNAIDGLFSSHLTIGGLFSAEGFGQHSFSAAGSGAQRLLIRNTSPGVGNFAELVLGNNADAGAGHIAVTSSNFTPSGSALQDCMAIQATAIGGLSVATTHALASLRLYSGAQGLRVTIDQAGRFGYLTAPTTQFIYSYSGSLIAPAGLEGRGMHFGPTVTGSQNQNMAGFGSQAVLNRSSSGGAHVWARGTYYLPPVLGAGAASITNAATVYVGGAPIGTPATSNYAFYVESGESALLGPVSLSDGAITPGLMALQFENDPDNGIYRVGTNEWALVSAGVSRIVLRSTDLLLPGATEITGDLIPTTAGVPNLGSSSKRWGNIYAGLTVGSHTPVHVNTSTNQLLVASSSRRYKTDIKPLRTSLAELLRLRAITYREKANPKGRRWPGLVAEDVAEAIPALAVRGKKRQVDSVLYDRLPIYLVEAIRELARRIERIETAQRI